jgi:uncharacterized protein (DUF1330 family)
MSAYLVGAIDIHDPEEYALYQKGAAKALAPFNAELLSGDEHPKMFEGAQPAGHLFIVKFASIEQMDEFFASEAYSELIPVRHRSSTVRFIMGMRGLAG